MRERKVKKNMQRIGLIFIGVWICSTNIDHFDVSSTLSGMRFRGFFRQFPSDFIGGYSQSTPFGVGRGTKPEGLQRE